MCVRRLGVLGGTFDPIHFGHLRLAEEARAQLDLDRVLLIPAGAPPHKLGVPVTNAQDRLIMTILACAPYEELEVSTMEMERRGASYTVDTLANLHRSYGKVVEIFFIIGADAVLEMNTWKSPERVLDLCQLLIAGRPGFDLDRLSELNVSGLPERARLLQAPLDSVSSTEIRRRVREGRSIRFLTPDPVVAYIRKQGLYRARVEPTCDA